MSKLIYRYDQTGELISTKLVDDQYVLGTNETLVQVPSGMYDPTFNRNEQQWHGAPAPQPIPKQLSDVMQAINILGLQVAKINQQLSKEGESKNV